MTVKLDAAIRFAQTIAIYQVESARPDWFEAVCTACGRSTTGAGWVVEEWGYDHIHECAVRERPHRIVIRHPRLTRNSLSDNGRHTPGEGRPRPAIPAVPVTRPGADIHELIERSSLGTPVAKALRESVPVEVAERIVQRANARRASGSLDVGPHLGVEGGRPGAAADVGPSAPLDVSNRYRAALQRIAAAPCAHGGGVFTCPEMPGDDWCPSCVAYDALNPTDSSPQPHPLRSEDAPARQGSPSVPCGGSKSP